ncbi:MAG: cupredoxin domain-containing protein [Vicinamibacterales bacterium]
MRNRSTTGHRLLALLAVGAVAAAVLAVLLSHPWSALAAGATVPEVPNPQSATREVTLHARKYAFDPDRIEVQKNDLVKVTFYADDIPHSFTMDAYRISKRAAPGAPVVFEFHADQAGKFPFYCRLTNDEGCRDMKGELVVYERRPQP